MKILLDILQPVTFSAIVGCILGGVLISLTYWRVIHLSLYNSLVTSLPFFLIMFAVGHFSDNTLGWLGVYILYVVFWIAAFVTKLIWERVTKKPYA